MKVPVSRRAFDFTSKVDHLHGPCGPCGPCGLHGPCARIDSNVTHYATFQSHNQKVVANEHGYFTTHIRDRDKPYLAQTWRVSRSTDRGANFKTIFQRTDATNPPVIETDSEGNLYLIQVWFDFARTPIEIPAAADDSGPTDQTSSADEFESHTWLSSMAMLGGKSHFAYMTQTDPPSENYIRFDLASGKKDVHLLQFKGDQIRVLGLRRLLFPHREGLKQLSCQLRSSPCETPRLNHIPSWPSFQDAKSCFPRSL